MLLKTVNVLFYFALHTQAHIAVNKSCYFAQNYVASLLFAVDLLELNWQTITA